MYVVGVLSFFENHICLEKIDASSPEEALRKHSLVNGYEFAENTTLEDMEDVLCNCDMTASVLEI